MGEALAPPGAQPPRLLETVSRHTPDLVGDYEIDPDERIGFSSPDWQPAEPTVITGVELVLIDPPLDEVSAVIVHVAGPPATTLRWSINSHETSWSPTTSGRCWR